MAITFFEERTMRYRRSVLLLGPLAVVFGFATPCGGQKYTIHTPDASSEHATSKAAGADWRTLPHLWGIAALDTDTVITVGIGGTILRSTNGGATWISQSSGTIYYWLLAISCAGANTCTAVESYGTIVRTTDGGVTWNPQSSGTTNDLWGVSCPDANTCTAGGTARAILRPHAGRPTCT